MHHAVGAFFVISGAVGVPVGLIHQFTESLGIAFAQQITRALPTEHRAGRIAPRRAVVALVAGEKIQKQARLRERPFLAVVAAAQNSAEQLFGLLAVQEVLLVGRTLIRVAR